MIKVLLVDDSRIVWEAFSARLERSGKYEVICAAGAADAMLYCERHEIELVLMDTCLRDGSAFDTVESLKEIRPEAKIVLISSYPEVTFISRARESGCDGFWYKEHSSLGLTELCGAIMAGERIFPQRTPVVRVGETMSSDFTDREMEVIRALAHGQMYTDIANAMSITTNTVKFHIHNLLKKTGYTNTLRLVADVVSSHLIIPEL